VSPYGHLGCGTLRDAPLGAPLRAPARRRMSGWEVGAMRCRIRDRKDEAINRGGPTRSATGARRMRGDRRVNIGASFRRRLR
jgi:hypothetical protein